MQKGRRTYTLLGILQSHAPSGSAQQMCTDFYNKMISIDMSDRDVELNLIRALHDGLEHGNWPWMVADMITDPTPITKDDLGFDPAMATPTGNIPDVDATTRKYSAKLQDIYDNRTAVNYTFLGVLAHFLMEVQGVIVRVVNDSVKKD